MTWVDGKHCSLSFSNEHALFRALVHLLQTIYCIQENGRMNEIIADHVTYSQSHSLKVVM